MIIKKLNKIQNDTIHAYKVKNDLIGNNSS